MPIASLSLDLDDKWSYLKTHGDAGWERLPSYLETVVPRVLSMLADRGLTITWFIVGQDAALERNHRMLESIAAAGHEIGNHSFHHEPWLHLYTPEQIAEELARGEEAIETATGVRPRGFRGPGFSSSPTVLNTLAARGYEYDASSFPTYLGPLARAYYFFTARLSRQERQDRKQLFGRWTDGIGTLRPHWRSCDSAASDRIVEIPVTTMPVFKTPIHLSYLLYLSRFSTLAARMYLRMALTLCRCSGVAPSFLLHPLDFIGGDEERDLGFFPAMDLTTERKLAFASWVLDLLTERFEIVTLREHARRFVGEGERGRVGEREFDGLEVGAPKNLSQNPWLGQETGHNNVPPTVLG